jgi:phosphoribosyl 1,2-cyclic phosphodiesterase
MIPDDAVLEITFLGTRGYIEESSALHRAHSACLLACGGKRLLLDAGETWEGHVDELGADWIAITHAHPDHAFGLRAGVAAPVYATPASCVVLEGFPIADLRRIEPDRLVRLGPFRLTAYAVIHSIRAPAVGFRIRAAGVTIVYNPDLVAIVDRERVLRGVDAYIGDGATLTRPLVRRRGAALFGHTTVRAQLGWCREARIPRAFIVHCGKQLVEMQPVELQHEVARLAGADVEAVVTHDGMRVVIPPSHRSASRWLARTHAGRAAKTV